MMKTLRRLGIVLLAAVFLGGCAGIDVEQYRACLLYTSRCV